MGGSPHGEYEHGNFGEEKGAAAAGRGLFYLAETPMLRLRVRTAPQLGQALKIRLFDYLISRRGLKLLKADRLSAPELMKTWSNFLRTGSGSHISL